MPDWVQITNSPHIIDAVRKAKVRHDGMYSNGFIWVPKWVKVAIDIYQGHTQELGHKYADMELWEFLNFSNPLKDK